MKKFLLSLVLLAFAGIASAQTLKFEQAHNFEAIGEIEPGRFEIIADVNEMIELAFEMKITNLTDSDILILCEREIVSSNSEAGNNFCFGNCFGDDTSQAEVNLTPGTPLDFSAHFKPYKYDENWNLEMMPEGSEMTVKYTFSERTLGEWVFEFYFKYDPAAGPYNPVFIPENNNEEIFSNAYPNPARDVVSFDYNMPFNAQSASVAIYNMMGQEVVRQNVSVGGSRLDVNVSDLTDGVYFYSLIVNNQAVKTNKLVISK